MLDLDQGWFIPLHEQDTLAALLRDEVPDILAALAACITAEGHRTRISYDPKVTNGSDEQPLPYDNSAQDAADHLGNELATWVRHTCEHRGIDYAGSWSPAGWAKWLADNIIALALTPGADEAPAMIGQAVAGARRAARIPKRRTWGGSVEEARDTQLNASAIEVAAKELGLEYTNLTRDRVNSLKRARRIQPVRYFNDMPIYRLGEVMDAHLATRTRNTKKAV
ncbi:hypothetical protein GS481_02390 [Rhodococcus hoagii]|nr:hypothetical protein [Prescottella equi]NKR53020.1 hypothetical protein [Prescottella equi]